MGVIVKPTTWAPARIAMISIALFVSCARNSSNAFSAPKVKSRPFVFSPKAERDKPKLVIIGGCPGTGKSTFGMSVALDQGILKCISTDTVRAVMRSFIPEDISPALHRSSYVPSTEGDDPVRSWRETCTVLEASVEGLVDDAITRGVGLVLEGVSIAPSPKLIKKWEDGGGIAIGCLLTVSDETVHKSFLQRRGLISGKNSGQNLKDEKKLQSFDRIRKIQQEMMDLARESNWLLIEQKIEPDPLEIIADKLLSDECDIVDNKTAGFVKEILDRDLGSSALNIRKTADELTLTDFEKSPSRINNTSYLESM